MLQGLGFSGAGERLPLNIPDQTNDPKGLRPIMFHPPREILERGGVKFQVSQWFRRARALADAPSLPVGGASSSPISVGGPFPALTQCRATMISARSRQSARHSHWRRTGSQRPASFTVYSVSAPTDPRVTLNASD